jgi:hypothetical protein
MAGAMRVTEAMRAAAMLSLLALGLTVAGDPAGTAEVPSSQPLTFGGRVVLFNGPGAMGGREVFLDGVDLGMVAANCSATLDLRAGVYHFDAPTKVWPLTVSHMLDIHVRPAGMTYIDLTVFDRSGSGFVTRFVDLDEASERIVDRLCHVRLRAPPGGEAIAAPRVPATRNAENESAVDALAATLRTAPMPDKRLAAIRIVKERLSSPRLVEAARAQVEARYRVEDGEAVDALAWMCNVVAASLDTAQVPFLEDVREHAASDKVRRWAAVYLKRYFQIEH